MYPTLFLASLLCRVLGGVAEAVVEFRGGTWGVRFVLLRREGLDMWSGGRGEFE